VKCVTHDEPNSLLLIGYPWPGEPRPSLHAMPFIYPHYTLLLGLGIEESEHFGATDLTG
jgi:hypothetical protein